MNFVLVFLTIHNRQKTQKRNLSQHLVKMLVKVILEVHLSAQSMEQRLWLGSFLMVVDVAKLENQGFMEKLIISKNGFEQVSNQLSIYNTAYCRQSNIVSILKI